MTDTFKGNCGFLLLPTVGNATPASFHTISLSVNSNLKFASSTDKTTSV